jgi:hypothetical protein
MISGHLAINHCTVGENTIVQPLFVNNKPGDYSFFLDAQGVSSMLNYSN